MAIPVSNLKSTRVFDADLKLKVVQMGTQVSHKLIEDLHKRVCPQVAISQAFGLLEVSRSGYYANAAAHQKCLDAPMLCAASIHLKAAFAASHKAYGSRRLRAAMAERGLNYGQASRAHLDAAQWHAACLAVQDCSSDGH